MTNARKPQAIETFPKEFQQVVERAYEAGSHFIRCASLREAHSLKFQLGRYLKSAPYYHPDTDLAHKCLMIKIRMGKEDIELVNMEKDSCTLSLRQSLIEQDGTTLDPQARAAHSLDDEFAELRRLEAEGKLHTPGK